MWIFSWNTQATMLKMKPRIAPRAFRRVRYCGAPTQVAPKPQTKYGAPEVDARSPTARRTH